jgi:hypothetical protein
MRKWSFTLLNNIMVLIFLFLVFFFLKKKDVATFDRGKRWDDPSLPYRRTLVDELEKP